MTVLFFTRPKDRIKESVKIAEDMGFEAIGFQSVEIVHKDPAEIKREISLISNGWADIVVFASPTTVIECERIVGHNMVNCFGKTELLSIGPGTAKELKRVGLDSKIPEDYSSAGLVEFLGDLLSRKRITILRSDKGSDVLRKGFEKAGATVTEVAVYGLTKAGSDVDKVISKKIDAYAFTSAFSAKCFIDAVNERIGEEKTIEMFRNSFVSAIGRPTADCLEKMGVKVDMIPENSTFIDLLTEIRSKIGV